MSLFVDLDTRKVVFVTKGKDSSTVQAFKDHLIKYGGSPERITDFSCDLSPAFINGIEDNFPRAHITFDKFHVMKLLNNADDETRRSEQVDEKDLKRPDISGSRTLRIYESKENYNRYRHYN